MALTPLAQLRVSRYMIPAHKLTPNSTISKQPLLVYHSVFDPGSVSASSIEAHFSKIGVVEPQWRYSMYPTSHFHSTTHEVLGIASGKAELCFGHEENPSRVLMEVQRGDVIVIPAGVAHRLMNDLEGEFSMVGAYPPGKQWDMCYGKQGEENKVYEISRLAWFEQDPVYGEDGPVLKGQE